jgi:hypothetical protein
MNAQTMEQLEWPLLAIKAKFGAIRRYRCQDRETTS